MAIAQPQVIGPEWLSSVVPKTTDDQRIPAAVRSSTLARQNSRTEDRSRSLALTSRFQEFLFH